VLYPPADVVTALLETTQSGSNPLHIGHLIARSDVGVSLSGDRVVARHMAILAMTGGGKTVAARRILRELIEKRYPVLVLDPHGDYLGLAQKGALFPDSQIKLFFPHISISPKTKDVVQILIQKMTMGLTEPQQEEMHSALVKEEPTVGEPIVQYIERLVGALRSREGSKQRTLAVCRRQLETVKRQLEHMESTSDAMRSRLKNLNFAKLPDPNVSPQKIIKPGQVSILYLGGYDHLTQTTIASILLQALYERRADLSQKIPPFVTLIEEAHTFIPSGREAQEEAPSIGIVRKMITEGRKFGTGLILVSQRPSRVDETILSQCNSFLVLRLVNPRDQSFVKQVMENLSDQDARLLPSFGPGQGIVSGQAVRFPLLVSVRYDADLQSDNLGGNENFFQQSRDWKISRAAREGEELIDILEPSGSRERQPDTPEEESPETTPQKRWDELRPWLSELDTDRYNMGLVVAATSLKWPKNQYSKSLKSFSVLSWGQLGSGAGLSTREKTRLLNALEVFRNDSVKEKSGR